MADYQGPLSAGSLFTVDGVGEDPAALKPVAIRARVVRIGPDGRQLTVSFLVIDTPGYTVLQRLIGARMKAIDAPPTAD